MSSRIVNAAATVLLAGGLCWWLAQAEADDNDPTIGRPRLSTGLGLPGAPLLPRGGSDEDYAGNPTCIPSANTLQVGVTGPFKQLCGDGAWVSMAYPVMTSGAAIVSINIIHNTITISI